MTRSILVVDDVPANRILLRARLGAACYRTALASTGAEALAAIRAQPPDLILLDSGLPDMTGLALCRRIKADPASAAIPLIVFAPDHAASLDALQAGADDALVRPVDERLLGARIRNLLRAGDRLSWGAGAPEELERLGLAEAAPEFCGPARIGLVAARRDIALRWKTVLAPHLSAQLEIMNWEDTLEATGSPPDLFLVAGDLGPVTDGLRLMSDLRSRPGSRDSAICLVLPGGAEAETAVALDLGADDVLREGFDGVEAAARAQRLIARKRRQDGQRDRLAAGLRAAVIDPLTGLHNRRHAFPALARMIAAGTLAPGSGAVMLLDLDHFKRVNDGYGHAAGDAVLVETAARLRAQLGPDDLIARLGGEEFLIALPGVAPTAARQLAERLRLALSDVPVNLPDTGAALRVTVSIGLVFVATAIEAVESLIARADHAMLGAKFRGRDKVGIACQAAPGV